MITLIKIVFKELIEFLNFILQLALLLPYANEPTDWPGDQQHNSTDHEERVGFQLGPIIMKNTNLLSLLKCCIL